MWALSFVFMAGLAVYQRLTGPTHPVRVTIELQGVTIKEKLPRTSDDKMGELIRIKAADTAVSGTYQYKRYKSDDEWICLPLKREGDELTLRLPPLPPAGKMMYSVTLQKGSEQVVMTKDPVVLRYKGVVPGFILYPHILFMFLAMVFSTRAGVEALFKRKQSYQLAVWTTIFFILGGMLLGPTVQKYAFGAFWTGWPFGHDLTDNKTAVALLGWLVAIFMLRKNHNARGWVIAASLILLAVYLIPHSVLGSEIDYTKAR